MMFRKPRLTLLALLLTLSVALLTLASCISKPPQSSSHSDCSAKHSTTGGTGNCRKRLLVFSKTGAFRHASIKDGKIALQKLATEHNFAIDFSEDSTVFSDANLSQYNAVVFLLTTGNILDDDQKAAFERYIRAGGGYAGIHSASDTEYNWSWYGQLVGAYFHSHPSITQAAINVVDNKHPSTAMLSERWVRTDEWYNFRTNLR